MKNACQKERGSARTKRETLHFYRATVADALFKCGPRQKFLATEEGLPGPIQVDEVNVMPIPNRPAFPLPAPESK